MAIRSLLMAAALMVCTSCAWSIPGDKRTVPRVIVIFGDSTSAPRPGVKIFASILQDRVPETKIVNAGVPGNTTRDAMARLDRDVISWHPDIVTIFFGINDSAVDVWKGAAQPRVPLADYRANLEEMIAIIRRAGAVPILLTPNPIAWTSELRELYGKPPYQPENPDGCNVWLRQYAQAARDVAAQDHVSLADVDQIFREYAAERGHHLEDLLVDGMHPNDVGHQLIADQILKLLK
jgi:lysophospholipase L1-like esterase